MTTAIKLPAQILLVLVFAVSVSDVRDLKGQDREASFKKDVAPIFQKYCVGCHNAKENEGSFSLESAEAIAKGGDSGPALFPGNAKASRLVRMMTGQLEPKMPPEDSKAPTQAEIESVISWIDAGAKISPEVSLVQKQLTVPSVDSKVDTDPVTDLAWSADGKWVAAARYSRVQVFVGETRKQHLVLKDFPGKVNSIQFSPDGTRILAASGITGLKGEASEWDVATGKKLRQLEGHGDVLYAAVYSPDGKFIATAGYDRTIRIWNRTNGKLIRSLQGHNDAVYDLDFGPESKVLASASGDQTVKVWSVLSGERLDTLGQPLKEQFSVRFQPHSDRIFAGGRDNRIRVWQWISKNAPRINPLQVARFAHEASIVALAFSQDGKLLVTSAEDKSIKVWSGDNVQLIGQLPIQPDLVYGMALSPSNILVVGRLDGSIDYFDLNPQWKKAATAKPQVVATKIDPSDTTNGVPPAKDSAAIESVAEVEPNHLVESAQMLNLPGKVSGRFDIVEEEQDVELFRFQAEKGKTYVLETVQVNGSKADPRLEVLTTDQKRIPRVTLQATRDSYFTFRGKDTSTSGDFRVHNWEEMELNEYLYCNGEVVRLFLYPRGPDSGFNVYPGFGSRHTFFDTTPTSHALQEPCYIVEPHPPGTRLIPNGLPVFTLYYENDDDAKRKSGKQARLLFKAPETAEYLVRLTDARGFKGEAFSYELVVRESNPGFQVNFNRDARVIQRGTGNEVTFTAVRTDGFMGEIRIEFEDVPPSLYLPESLTIEENHYRASVNLFMRTGADPVTAEQLQQMKITAIGNVGGKTIRKDLGKFAELKINGLPKVKLRILPRNMKLTPEQRESLFSNETEVKPLELTIHPGETISAQIAAHRDGHKGDIDFGKEDAGRNLPHGVIVDNIGLNGLRVIAGQGDTREFFITAAKWVEPQKRTFYLRANNVGGVTSFPVILKVVPRESQSK